MSKQVINRGTFDNDPSAESVRSAFGKVNANFDDLYKNGDNILAAGALGNSNYVDGGGQDDTTYIQALYNAAGAAGGTAHVIFPGRRTYRVTSTIVVPQGVNTLGLGGLGDGGSTNPPIILWDGNATDGVFTVATSSGNVFGTAFSNISIRGGGNITNKPKWGVKFVSSGGPSEAKVDTGTFFDNVWFAGINGNAVHLGLGGATNFFLRGGRFDGTYGGYGIYAPLTSASYNANINIYDTTYANVANGGVAGKGFLHLDAEGVAGFAGSQVLICGFHMEGSVSLEETFSTGSNPYDKRGVIRCGVAPGLNVIQHRLTMINCTYRPAADLAANSWVQVTANSGTDTEASDKVYARIINGIGLSDSQSGSGDAGTTNEIRIFGGKVPAERRFPYVTNTHHGDVCLGAGADSNSDGIRSFQYYRDASYRLRGLCIHPDTGTDAPQIFSGTGAPSVNAPLGSLYLRTDGDTSTSLYVKTAAGGGAGNWTAK